MAEHFTGTEDDWKLRNELPNDKMADHAVMFSTELTSFGIRDAFSQPASPANPSATSLVTASYTNA